MLLRKDSLIWHKDRAYTRRKGGMNGGRGHSEGGSEGQERDIKRGSEERHEGGRTDAKE